MPKFRVTINCDVYNEYVVDADNADEAKDKANMGEVDLDDSTCKFSEVISCVEEND
jgi:hypothetical protein|tara:strand:- start:1988 stop:2155 length:168 start_codon:yes stop_codon:yes gene_type:complete